MKKITDKMMLDWILAYLSNHPSGWNRHWGRQNLEFAIQSGITAHGSFKKALLAEQRGTRK